MHIRTNPQGIGSIAEPSRLHYLDWLRVLAILIVFLFHAVHPFDFGDWQIKNVEQSEILTIILTILSIWGMPFFFLVAGAGSWFALQKRTGHMYLRERFYRLLIPFIVGTLLFSPLEYYCENLNKIQRGLQTSFPGFLATFAAFDPRLMHFPGFSPRWMGYGYHLWFLGFLFCFAVLTLPIFSWLKKNPGLSFLNWMAKLCELRAGLLLFIIPIAIIKVVLTPLAPLEHDWADFIYQMCFFALGFMLFADQRFLNAIRKDRWILITIPTIIILILLVMYMSDVPVMDWYYTPGVLGFYLLQLFGTIIAVCYSLVMLFVGMHFLDFSNKWLHYGQEAALPFFVLHQPMIIIIAFFVVQWEVGIMLKLPVVVLSSFAISICLYEIIIRRFKPLRSAFGMKATTPHRG
ncbi:MAG: acyltransferase family protein [Acidobacteriaceae bacterium]